MKDTDLLEGMRQSLDACRRSIQESIEKVYDLSVCAESIEVRTKNSLPHLENLQKKTEIIQTLLQGKTPEWVSKVRNNSRGMIDGGINSRYLLHLISQPYPDWITFRFSQDFDFKDMDDQVAFIDVDMKDIDRRIVDIISELQDIIDNHGAQITATIEKELITLILKIKKSQFQSLFGRKAALFLLTIFLSNCISDKTNIISPDAKTKVEQIQEKTQETVRQIHKSEKDALFQNAQGHTFNGCTINITGTETKLLQEHE